MAEGRDIDTHLYHWDFINQSQEADYFCTLCHKLLNEPMLTECCGVHFCKTCIAPYKMASPCPSCNKATFVCILDKPRWKKILELEVYCPLKGRGCQWKGEIGKCGPHLAILTGDCEYMDLDCPNRCGENLERHELADHLEKFCSRRQITCQHCGEVGFHETIFGDHTLECPEHPILCPNECGQGYIKQSSYEQHMEECSELVVPCCFNYAGCDTHLPRKSIAEHLEGNISSHLKLQSTFVQKRIAESDHKVQLCAEKCKKKMEELAKSKEKLLEDIGKRHKQRLEQMSLESAERLKMIARERDQKLDTLIWNFEQTHNQLECRAKDLIKKQPNMLWELDREQLELVTKIAAGQFSEVWRGVKSKEDDTTNPETIAIKRHRPGTTTSDRFLHEAFIMRDMEHDNVLKLYGVSTSGSPMFIVTEFMFGNLLHYLRNEGKKLTQSQQIDINRQVASGMAYLEKSNCIHRSVMTQSILVGYNLRCKVGSFSSAHILDEGTHEYVPQGERVPIKWSAPEVLIHNICSVKSDVWSYGILLYEVMTCKKLKMTIPEAEALIKSGKHLDIPPNCPENLYRIMVDCWNKDPKQRPTFSAMVELLNNFRF